MLKDIKLAILKASNAAGLSKLVSKTSWRRQKLLILCYHGISLEDEHQADPLLYLPLDLLQKRFEYLSRAQANVLPLHEAVRRLYANDLPDRAVAITFDDGFYDFKVRAVPLAKQFGFPITVYLTTYYSFFNRPVFDPALNYIVWKARGRTLHFPEALAEPSVVDDQSWKCIARKLSRYAEQSCFSGKEKDELLQCVAVALESDYGELRRKRILHIMTPKEVQEVKREGVDIQLHTHRHRVTNDKQQFQQEIVDNQDYIAEITHEQARHFCYPSGFYLPEYAAWLRELEILSATTCVPGIATRRTSPLLLPRLVDTSSVTETEFGTWVNGIASLLPRRKFQMDGASYVSSQLSRAPNTMQVSDLPGDKRRPLELDCAASGTGACHRSTQPDSLLR